MIAGCRWRRRRKHSGVMVSICAAVVFAALPAHGCDRTLRVGLDDWPPFESMQTNGPRGINIQILRVLAEATGCAFEWHGYPWKRTLRKIRKGQLDMTTTANKTPERKVYARFSASYLPYEAVLFLRSDDRTTYKNLRAFLEGGKNLAVVQEYTYGTHADALLKSEPFRNQVYATYNVDESIRALAHGRVDGTIGNRYTLAYAAQQIGANDAIRPTQTIVQREPVHFMFSRKTVPQQIVTKFNAAIRKLKEQGRIKAIARSYVESRD